MSNFWYGRPHVQILRNQELKVSWAPVIMYVDNSRTVNMNCETYKHIPNVLILLKFDIHNYKFISYSDLIWELCKVVYLDTGKDLINTLYNMNYILTVCLHTLHNDPRKFCCYHSHISHCESWNSYVIHEAHR